MRNWKSNILKKGQVWIETVLYTLIGLALIGLALGFIMPEINKAKDKALVEQAINSLNIFDEKINEVIQRGAGNIRQAEFLIKKGELYIDCQTDEIKLVLSGLSSMQSEPGVPVHIGRIEMISTEGQKTSEVSLRIAYEADLTYDGKDELRKFVPVSIPYNFLIENKGAIQKNSENKILINIEEISNK